MRRQQAWMLLADRLGIDRKTVLAVCVLLNLRWSPSEVSQDLDIEDELTNHIADAAKPLLRQPRISKRSRRVGGACAYCGSTHDLSRDHVVPKSRGGSLDPSNIVIACRNCNSAKGNRTPEEWLG